MPAYTYGPAPVLVELTGEFAIGATGVLRETETSAAVPMYDLNGSPITSILVGPKGAHQGFKADIAYGVLDFGSVLLPTSSLEQQHAGLDSVASAQAAAIAATAAQESADNALAVALSAGKFIIHGSNAAAPRNTDPASPVVWFGTVAPTNLIAGFDIWMNTSAGSGGISQVTIANSAPQAMFAQVQNTNGSWPNRPTSRTDVTVAWIRTVASTSDPVKVTAPAVNGSYANDVVFGA